MNHEKSNRKTLLFGALIIVVLVGICFTCVTFYAKNEINKPKFQVPEPTDPLLTEVLSDKDAAFAYAMQKYTLLLGADDVEGSWKTNMRRLDDAWETPFSKADNAIFSAIRKKAGDRLKEMYPKADNVLLCERTDVPQFTKQAQDLLDFTLTLGRENDKKEIVDKDRYFLTLTFDPQSEDTQAMLESEAFRNIAGELSPVAELFDTQIETESVTMCFEIEAINEELLSVETKRDLRVRTSIRLTDDAAALLEQREGTIVLPYGTTQRIEFKHYGAHFTQPAIAVKPKDIKALPAKVVVRSDATKADYSLTFTASEPSLLSFDEDGVMTVGKEATDDPVTVTMTLVYNGHTYTDKLTVYITRLEVENDVGA